MNTTTIKTHIVNLDLPPEDRWHFLRDYITEMEELLSYYLEDLRQFFDAFISAEDFAMYSEVFIKESYKKEIASIASMSSFSTEDILLANLYYDALKMYLGCTAFAVVNEHQALHARNLDWFTINNLLSKHSIVLDFQKNNQTLYKTVGWPGFVGTLSGTRPGAFSVTLNAVTSQDKAEIAAPISFVLRDILEDCDSFDKAKTILCNTTIPCDCLLLLSGVRPEEKVVIERTPKRFALRETDAPYITVTNDYKQLENESVSDNVLHSTSCGRFDRAMDHLGKGLPQTAEACLAILKDPNIQMEITVQQMVFNTLTGEVLAVKT
ncbi:MAG: C45 family autoproteolytic acyltransferase/hydrolase [Bacteroidia bacterium]